MIELKKMQYVYGFFASNLYLSLTSHFSFGSSPRLILCSGFFESYYTFLNKQFQFFYSRDRQAEVLKWRLPTGSTWLPTGEGTILCTTSVVHDNYTHGFTCFNAHTCTLKIPWTWNSRSTTHAVRRQTDAALTRNSTWGCRDQSGPIGASHPHGVPDHSEMSNNVGWGTYLMQH